MMPIDNEGINPFRGIMRWVLRLAVVASLSFLIYIIAAAFIRLRTMPSADSSTIGQKEDK